ncbi:MAG: c-type cytochrome [Bryobacteraceae bacterium]
MKTLTLVLFPVWLAAQSGAPPAANPLDEGRALFRSNCAFCHGLDGRGGRGPNLVSAPRTHGSSDGAVKNVIRKGVPGSTMPAFSTLEPAELNALVAFVHHLAAGAGSTVQVPGDAAKGRLVYESNGCANCHRIGRKGSAFGPELTRIGASRSLDYLTQSIAKPSADIPEEYGGVAVVTKAGQRITGVRINEDTFTIQIRDPSQEFRNFDKSELQSVTEMKQSLMPPYRLAPQDLENLLAYLTSLKSASPMGGQVKEAEGIR